MSSADTSYNENPLAVNPLIVDGCSHESSSVRAASLIPNPYIEVTP